MKQIFTAGASSPIDEGLFLQDATSTSGGGLSGLAYNTSGLACYYKRNTGAASVSAPLTAIATLGTYTSGGFREIDPVNMPGMYEFHPPAAALAAGATSVTFYFQGAPNLVPRPIQYEISAVNLQDATRGGLAALPAAASGSAGGLLVQGTGTTGLNVSGGKAPASLTAGDCSGNLPAAVSSYATGQDPASLLAGSFSSLQSHGDSAWATATGFSTSSQATALLSAVNNLNNLTALANFFGPSAMVPPASGSITYAFAVNIRDSEGNLVDADSTPSVAVTNLAGTDLAGRLSALTSATTGVYAFTFTVDAGDLGSAVADEISFVCTPTVGGSPRRAELKVSLLAAEQLTSIATMLSILEQIQFDGANNVKAIVEAFGDGQAPPSSAAVAAAILATPANLLATDASGNVAANNLATVETHAANADSQSAAALAALGTAGSGLTSLPPVTLSDAYDLYLADVNLTKNSGTGTDEYTVVWFKNGVALASGVSAARIQVNNQDGSTLIGSTAMIGPTGASFYYNETANLVTAGSPVDVIVTATIDGQTRTFSRLTGRDA